MNEQKQQQQHPRKQTKKKRSTHLTLFATLFIKRVIRALTYYSNTFEMYEHTQDGRLGVFSFRFVHFKTIVIHAMYIYVAISDYYRHPPNKKNIVAGWSLHNAHGRFECI